MCWRRSKTKQKKIRRALKKARTKKIKLKQANAKEDVISFGGGLGL